jgi:ATP-dependent DNA helicase RecG
VGDSALPNEGGRRSGIPSLGIDFSGISGYPRAVARILFDTPMDAVGMLTGREVSALAEAGLGAVGDLLMRLPRRYEDRRRFDVFPAQAGGAPVCLRGTVVDTGRRRFGRGRQFFEAVVMDGSGGVFGSGKVTCRWFNMPFMHKVMAAGQEVVVFGKPKEQRGRLIMDHPEFEVLKDTGPGESIHLERIVPIYRNVHGIAQRRLREIIHGLLGEIDPASVDAGFPVDVDPAYPRREALREAHFPESIEQADAARRRFALEEFFALQLNVVWRRMRFLERPGRAIGMRAALLREFYKSLPFDLTDAQKRSVKEIIADMRSPRPMHRLLQGDVGSGKTFVAMCAMLMAVDSGVQAALMAPTQILAEQHFLTFRHWLEPLGVRLALKTAAREESTHMPLEGDPQIVIGTHALLYEGAEFRDLGLAVIDEQHKFGVAQRAALAGRGTQPDVLVMTATPIPRTLTMTLYGDLDVSVLDELPPGRGKIVTGLRTGAKVREVTKFLKEQLDAGRQAYLVYPLVEDSAALQAQSATAEHEKWRKRLPNHEVGLLHGRMSPEEKDAVMTRFRDGGTDVLVATTVIEVGVDVPNATVMVIHNAERFGLAQLHQLRGRIGRGKHKSYCILLADPKNTEAMEKLKVLEKTNDGFEIAEADLRFRGPGDVLGTAQSGLGELRFAEFLADTKLLRKARQIAEAVLAEDPRLDGSRAAASRLVDSTPASETGVG